jgi:hypothetical protein
LAHIGDDLEVHENPSDCREVFVKIKNEMYVFECRARFRFFDILPGHESMVSQLVITEQSRIQGERSEKIHAGMAGHLLPDAEGAPQGESSPVGASPVVTASQVAAPTAGTTTDTATDTNPSGSNASSDAPTKAIVAPPMTHHPAPPSNTKRKGKKSKPPKQGPPPGGGSFDTSEPDDDELKVFKLT